MAESKSESRTASVLPFAWFFGLAVLQIRRVHLHSFAKLEKLATTQRGEKRLEMVDVQLGAAQQKKSNSQETIVCNIYK